MLFDQEYVKIQEGFRRIASVELADFSPELARFNTDEGVLEVSSYAAGIIRLSIKKEDSPDYGLIAAEPDTQMMRLEKSDGLFHISQGTLSLEIHTHPMRVRFYSNDRVLIESVTDRTIQGELRFSPFAYKEDEWLISLALQSGEGIYGLGEKFGPLNRRGQLITNWNRDATGVNAEISYKNTPFAWSTEGWGIFIHTPARVTHGVGYAPWSHRSYIVKIDEANLDVFLFAGKTPAEILEKYTWLTGRTSLPPVWSYGVWMSRAYYKTADELLDVAHKLRERRIPCDVITLDGRAWHKPETRFDFSWDPERYPDPAGFVKRLRELNLRLCLWEYPYLSIQNPLYSELEKKKYFLSNSDGSTFIYRWFPPPNDRVVPHLQPSAIFDFTNPEAYTWYREAHKALFDIGVSVVKPDYGEAVPDEIIGHNGDRGVRLHNVYALLYNRCVFEASEKYGEGIQWTRAGWAGSQRYPIQWGGDPQGDWEGLAGSIRGGLSWGMSGAPFYAHDIGGMYGESFAAGVLGGGKPETELYIRWAQAGIFCSHIRFHGTSPREPWEYGEEAEAIIRRWLGLRYRLIPYLQECALEANYSGIPIMRAMPLAFPEDPLAWNFDTQYMFGPALLVAPVLRPGGNVNLYLPAGGWYDLWSGEHFNGPQILSRKMPLEYIPVFGREGKTLNLGPAAQHIGELQGDLPKERIVFTGSNLESRSLL